MLGAMECPCGGCLPCRINRRRVWSHRILLESFKHADSCFVTLTYDGAHCPSELVVADYQKWLKRLRKSVFPRKIRFFLAGEYGSLTGRPHFHAAIFGLDQFTAGGVDGRGGVVQSSWNLGYTYVGELNERSGSYIAGYVTKKFSGRFVGSDKRAEFCRMSLRPGIGFASMDDVAGVLASEYGRQEIEGRGDVPYSLNHGKFSFPLGRYLRRCLREKLGFPSKDTPQLAHRMFALQKAAEKIEERAALKQEGYSSSDVFQIMLDKREQKIKNQTSRFDIRESQRSLK